MAYLIKVQPQTLQSVAFGSLTTGYTTLGTVSNMGVRLIKIVNNTNGLILISWNASNDHDVLPSNSFSLYDFTANKLDSNGLFVGKGTVISAKYSGTAPTSGSLYLVILYTGTV